MYTTCPRFVRPLIVPFLAATLAYAAPDNTAADTPDQPTYDIEARVITVPNTAPPIQTDSIGEWAQSPDASLLTAPRIWVRAGQDAHIAVGEELQYMERQKDGTFVLRASDPDAFAGIRLRARAEPMDSGLIMLTASLRLSVMEERESIPGVDLDVGKPVLAVTEVETRVAATPGEWTKVAGQALIDEASGAPERLVVTLRVSEIPPSASPAESP